MIGSAAKASAFWAMAVIGLLGVIVYQITDDRSAPFDVSAAAEAVVLPPPEALDGEAAALPPPEGLIDIIVSRPLFSPSRQPAEPAPPEPVTMEETSDDKLLPELIGTIMAGDARIALLKHPTEGVLRRRLGQRIGNWEIIDIQSQSVSLQRNGGIEDLRLRADQEQPSKPRNLIRPNPGGQIKNDPERPVEAPDQTSIPIRRPI